MLPLSAWPDMFHGPFLKCNYSCLMRRDQTGHDALAHVQCSFALGYIAHAMTLIYPGPSTSVCCHTVTDVRNVRHGPASMTCKRRPSTASTSHALLKVTLRMPLSS